MQVWNWNNYIFIKETRCQKQKNTKENFDNKMASEPTPLNKLAVADAVWVRVPVDGLNMGPCLNEEL